MISKWFHLKERAIAMRLKGSSLKDVNVSLGIPKSTLSCWFKDLHIKKEYRNILDSKWKNGLVKARIEAVKWHNNQRKKRIMHSEDEARKVIDKIDLSNVNIMELALSLLYLGEGFKKNSETGIGNSDPLILLFFIKTLNGIYGVKSENITCYLHLRADQKPEELNLYWSRKLKIPLKNFRKASIDKRTIGSKTYSSYKGVCVVRCGNIAIQRKLVYLSRIVCEKVIENLGG